MSEITFYQGVVGAGLLDFEIPIKRTSKLIFNNFLWSYTINCYFRLK